MKRYRDSQIRKVLAHPEIEVRLNTTVDASVVDEVRPDVLIAAVGGRPVTPPIPGVEGDNVFFGADLMPDTPLGKRVVVIGGGMIGCEESVYLSDLGHEVTIVELQDDIAADCLKYPFLWLHHEVEARAIRVLTSAGCTAITGDSVTVKHLDSGAEETFPCDSVVLAAGMRSRSDEVEALRPLCSTFYGGHRHGPVRRAERRLYGRHLRRGGHRWRQGHRRRRQRGAGPPPDPGRRHHL